MKLTLVRFFPLKFSLYAGGVGALGTGLLLGFLVEGVLSLDSLIASAAVSVACAVLLTGAYLCIAALAVNNAQHIEFTGTVSSSTRRRTTTVLRFEEAPYEVYSSWTGANAVATGAKLSMSLWVVPYLRVGFHNDTLTIWT